MKPNHRYYMLESVRAYAASEVAATADVDATIGRLAAWLVGVARKAGNHGLPDVIAMLPELDNIRAAIEAKLRSGIAEDVAIAGELVGSYRHLWTATNRNLELRQLCEAVMIRLDAQEHVSVAAIVATAMVASNRRDPKLLERAIELNTKAGDLDAVSAHLGMLALYHVFYGGDSEAALRAANRADETLKLVSPSKRAHHHARWNMVTVFLHHNDVPRARRTIADMDRVMDERGASGDLEYVFTRASLVAETDFAEGNYASVAALCRETYAMYASALPLSAEWLGFWLMQIESELMLDHVDDAAAGCKHFFVKRRQLADYGLEYYEAQFMQDVASVSAKRGDLQSAALLAGCADAILDRDGFRRTKAQRLIADKVRALLNQLDRSVLATLQADGARMTIEDARELVSTILADDVLT